MRACGENNMQNLKKRIKLVAQSLWFMPYTLISSEQMPGNSIDTQELFTLCMNDSFNPEKNNKARELIMKGALVTTPFWDQKNSFHNKTCLEIMEIRRAQEKVPVVRYLMLLFIESMQEAHKEMGAMRANTKKSLPHLLAPFMPQPLANLVTQYY